MRLIDAETLKKIIPETKVNGLGSCAYCTLLDSEQIEEIIDSAPTRDAEPVRKGRWMIEAYDRKTCSFALMPYNGLVSIQGILQCSECGRSALQNGAEEDVPSSYCPNCGAKMDGGVEND